MPGGQLDHHDTERGSEEEAADRVTASLAGLALTLALIVVSLCVTDHLRRMANLQDCVLSGRTDCTASQR
jgi:hypothetical protein